MNGNPSWNFSSFIPPPLYDEKESAGNVLQNESFALLTFLIMNRPCKFQYICLCLWCFDFVVLLAWWFNNNNTSPLHTFIMYPILGNKYYQNLHNVVTDNLETRLDSVI